MKIDNLAYELYMNDVIIKIGYSKYYFTKTFFFKNKENYKIYYQKANSILRKQKLQKLNEI